MSNLLELQDRLAEELLFLRNRVRELEREASLRNGAAGAAELAREDALDPLSEGVVIARDGRALAANRAILRLLALPDAQAVIGRDVAGELGLPVPVAGDRTCASDTEDLGGPGQALAWRGPDGLERFLLVRSGPALWEGTPATRLSYLDVTSWRRSQDRSQTELERLRALTEIASDGTWETGPDHRLVRVSSGFAALCGRTERELLGAELESLLGPGPFEDGDGGLGADLAGRRPFRDRVLVCRNGTGSDRYLALGGAPCFGPGPDFRGYRGIVRDVTAETARRMESDRRHRQLADAIESLPGSFHLFDAEERFVLANQRAREIFPEYLNAYVPGTPFRELLRFSYRNRLTRDSAGIGEEDWIEGWLERIKHPPEFYEYQRHNGRWIRSYDRRTCDGGRVSLRMDCTEDKRREEQLLRSREVFRTLIEASELPLLVQRELKPLFANRAYAELFGFGSVEEVMALSDVTQTMPPELRERMVAQYRARMAGQPAPPRFEREGLRRDGSRLWLDVFATVLEWEGQPALLGAFVDITERKKAENALRVSESRLRHLFERFPLAVLVHRELKPLFANRAWADLFGFASVEQALALPDISGTANPEDIPAIRERYRALVFENAEPLHVEREAIRADGSRFWTHALIAAVEWEGERAVLVAYVDITARKRAEEELRRSESVLLETQRLARIGSWEWDLRTAAVRWSPEMYRQYQVDPDPDVQISMDRATSSIHPEDRAKVRGNLERALETGRLERVEYRLVLGDGSIRHFVAEGELLKDGAGRPARVIGFAQEITERKLAEEALRQSEERFRRLFEENLLGMIVHRNERPIYANAALAKLFGYDSPEEVMALDSCNRLLSEEAIPVLNRYGELRLSGGSAPRLYTFRGRKKDGSDVWIQNTVTTLEWEGRLAILGTMQDVTELKLAEEARIASERRFRDFAEVASDWFWETGPDHRFTYLSERIEGVLGLGPSFYLGRSRWDPAGAAGVDWDAHRATLEARQPLRDFSYGLVDGRGQRRYVRVNGKPVFGEDGAFLGYRGTGTDITAERQATEEAERAHSRLTAAIESLPATFALYDGEDRLVLTNSKLREFFAGFAHCYQPGRRYEEVVRCVAASRLVADAFGREEEWAQERLRVFHDPPDSRDFALTDGRWMRAFDRATADGGVVSIRWDITELKKREQALRISEERFRGLVEGSIQAVIVHRNFKPVFANRAFLEMFGYTSVDQVLAMDLREMPYIAPRERERVLGYAQARIRGEPAPNRYRFEGIRQDGTPVWCDIAVSIVRWDGEPAILATYTDISDYMRAEQARRFSEEKFRNLVEGSIQGILIHQNFRLIYANEALARILGYESVEDLMRLSSALEFVAPEDRERVQGIGRARLHGEPAPERYEFLAVRKDGRRVWIETFNRRIEWEGGPAVQSAFYDVTERLQAVQELRSSRELLQTVFDALPVWVSVKDREGRFLMANRRAQLDTGLSAEQFQLMRTEDQPYLAAEEAARIRAADQRVLESGEPTEGEYPIALAPDRPRVHHTVKVPLRGAGGDIVGIVTVAEDITQRKMLEDELRQAQKMEAIGQLAGGVAHDFNNLLQIISGYTQFVLREASGNDAVARDLGQVLEATERGSQLTRQLLAFGRRQLLQRSEVDLNDSVQNLTRLLRRLFEENIELVSVPGANLLPVQADSGMIEQVLLNLCLNARDAMPQGGVLTLSTGNAALDREFCERNPGARPGRYAWVRVADTGRGVAPENVDRIFEPFFTTKEPGKGTGLGLAMAYGIVNQHGGLILVDNRPGEGAAFTVHLPAAAPAGLPDAAPEHSQPSGGRETILVAEDEARVRDMAERVLRHAGYSVLVAGDGEEAVREFEAHRDRIDLVLLDVIMPKRGGKVVYEHIRGLAPRLPVLFCSGYSGGSLGEYLEAGKPVRLLQKPFLADELLLKVRELLDRASPQSG